MNRKFALVLDEESMKSLTHEDGLIGVCAVDGETAETHILRGPSKLRSLLGDTPTAPFGIGSADVLLPLEEEREAIDHIINTVQQMNSKLESATMPEGIIAVPARLCGGFQVKMSPMGIDVRFSKTRAKLLNLEPFQKLQIGITTCGQFLAIFPSTKGAALCESMESPEYIVTDCEFPHLPLSVELLDTDWMDVEFNRFGEGVVFSLSSLTRKQELSVENSTQEKVTSHKSDYRLAATILIVVDICLLVTTALVICAVL